VLDQHTFITNVEHGIGDSFDAFPTENGDEVVWFHNVAGDEKGLWMVSPFFGGEARSLMGPDFPVLWTTGVAICGDLAFVGTYDESGEYCIWRRVGTEPPSVFMSARHALGVGAEGTYNTCGLSADGRFLAVWHAAHGDTLRLGVRFFGITDLMFLLSR
jgi:hypothetical protein